MQYALLSLPRSGSTWFFHQIAWPTTDQCYRHNCEFFNPGTNPNHRDDLTKAFGDFTFPENIGVADDATLERVYAQTWEKHDYRATKEVWSYAKVPFFVRHFETVALVRRREHTFPGRQSREWTRIWYDKLFHALTDDIDRYSGEERNLLQWIQSEAKRPRAQQIAAHTAASLILLRRCQEHKVPVFQWEALMEKTEAELHEYLVGIPGFDVNKTAKSIVETRLKPRRVSALEDRYAEVSNSDAFFKQIRDRFGGMLDEFPAQFG